MRFSSRKNDQMRNFSDYDEFSIYKILSQISAREIEKHVKTISGYGPRPDGSEACNLVGQYIERIFEQANLQVHRLPLDFSVIEDLITNIEVSKPIKRTFKCEGHLRTGLSTENGVTSRLVHVGKGFPEDFKNSNISGNIVLAFEDIPFEGNGPSRIRYFGERVSDAVNAGAKGIIFADYRPDDLIMTWGIKRDIAPIPCLAVSYPDYCHLRHLAESGDSIITITATGNIWASQSDVISAGPEGKSERSLIVLLGTHYETVPSCIGANDNASSLAILLELSRVFSKQALPIDLLYISSIGEEAGSFGAIEYVSTHKKWLVNRAKAVIAFDQVGGYDIPLSADGSPSLNELMIKTATDLGYKLRLDNDPELPLRTGLSDVQPFFDIGIQSVYLGGWASDPFYHTIYDTPDKMNPNALKVLADIIAASILCLSDQLS